MSISDEKFQALLCEPNFSPLYSALEAMSLDELVAFLERQGFSVGGSQELKRVVLWAVGEELAAMRDELRNNVKTPRMSAERFNHFVRQITLMLLRAEECPDTAKAEKQISYLVGKLEELQKFRRYPNQTYAPLKVLQALEHRMLRWLWRRNGINAHRTQPVATQVTTPKSRAVPTLQQALDDSKSPGPGKTPAKTVKPHPGTATQTPAARSAKTTSA